MKKWIGMLLALALLLAVSGSVVGSATEVNMCQELEDKANMLMYYDMGIVAPGGNFPVDTMLRFAFFRIDNVDQYALPMEEGNVDGYEVYVIPGEVLENVLLSYFAHFDMDALHNLTGGGVDPETWQWDDNFKFYDPESNTYTMPYQGGVGGGELRYSIIGYESDENIYYAYFDREMMYTGEGEPDDKEYNYSFDGKYYWIHEGYLKVGFLQEDTLKYYGWEESDTPYTYGELITPDTVFLPEDFSVEIVGGKVSAYESCRWEYIDKETGEPAYSYRWADYCRFDAVVNGKTYENISFEGLKQIVQEVYGLRVGGFTLGDQDNWEPGNHYTATMGLHMEETGVNIWQQEVQVELKESTVKIEILSDVTVDELMYDLVDDGDGKIWRYYDCFNGTLDFSLDGTVYENVALLEMERIVSDYVEEFEGVSAGLMYDSSIEPSYENQWEIGKIGTLQITYQLNATGEYVLFEEPVDLYLVETQIAGATAEPMEYYAFQGGGYTEITLIYKDGSTAPWYGDYEIEGEWPDTPGEHTAYITVLNEFRVPVQVTVLPNPTSGAIADTLTWKIDEKTGAMIFSGTGATEMDKDAYSMLMEIMLGNKDITTVVFKEGIEYLPDILLAYAMHVEELVLPNSLKELPAVFMGNNGPTDGLVHLGWESKGLTTLVIPESITSWTKLFYYYTWGVTDIYLPAGLTELNPENLCYIPFFRDNGGLGDVELPEYHLNVHFAGTQEQWEAIKYVVSEDAYTQSLSLREMGLDDAAMQEILKNITVTFNDPAPTYGKESIKVEEGVAAVPDSIVEIKKDEDVVIDITETYETVESVVLESATVDKIVEAETTVQVKLPDATVSLDKTAIGTLSEKAGTETVTIVAKNVKTETLTEKQTEALKEKEVLICLNLEAYAGQSKVSDFGGGKVTVSVPFEVPAEKKGSDFCVAYIDDNGKMTAMPTTYKDGILVFETTHFSSYIVLEKIHLNDNPPTGDNGIAMALALMTVSAAAVILLGKKKAF